MQLSDSSFIQLDVYVYATSGACTVGEDTIIGRGSILDCRGGLCIGSHVSISPSVYLFTAGHDPRSLDFRGVLRPVMIEDYVCIGSGSQVMPGARLARGTYVYPGSVVCKDTSQFDIVSGIPAVRIASRPSNLSYRVMFDHPFI